MFKAGALGFILLFVALGNADESAYSQRAPASTPSNSHIAVKIRSGKTGLPIWLASPYVFLGDVDPEKYMDYYRRTKLWGDAKVNVDPNTAPQLKIWVDFISRDCRYPEEAKAYLTFDFAGQTLKNTAAYDTKQVLATGIVAPNLCSAKTQKPEPGVLTIYVIPETLKELWNN